MTTTTHPARRTDPSTSHDAARLDRTTLTAQVRRILEAHPNGLTDDRLWRMTGLGYHRHGSVVKARLAAGAIDSKRKGVSESGRPCIIWVLPEVES